MNGGYKKCLAGIKFFNNNRKDQGSGPQITQIVADFSNSQRIEPVFYYLTIRRLNQLTMPIPGFWVPGSGVQKPVLLVLLV